MLCALVWAAVVLLAERASCCSSQHVSSVNQRSAALNKRNGAISVSGCLSLAGVRMCRSVDVFTATSSHQSHCCCRGNEENKLTQKLPEDSSKYIKDRIVNSDNLLIWEDR